MKTEIPRNLAVAVTNNHARTKTKNSLNDIEGKLEQELPTSIEINLTLKQQKNETKRRNKTV